MVAIIQGASIKYANPALTAVSGYANEEIMRMTFLDIVHPEERDLIKDRSIRRQRGESVPSRYELPIQTKVGTRRWVDFSAELIEYEGRSAVLGIGVDITSRKTVEEKLRRKEIELVHVSRLSMMGEMVAGIAHEINQPLFAISNFAQACSKTLETLDYESDVPIETWLTQLSEQAVRCGNIIRRLRSFVKKSDDEWTVVDLNEVVHDAVALVRFDVRRKPTAIDCRLLDPGPRVYGSEVQLQQVLVNILQNACDATAERTDPEVSVQLEVGNRRAFIRVRDNGPGIDERHRKQLFHAFFSTKPDGLGMGLAISKSIIEAHRGRLRLESSPHSGATFHIELPLCESTLTNESALSRPHAVQSKATG